MAKSSVFTTVVLIVCCILVLGVVVCAILGLAFSTRLRNTSSIHSYCFIMNSANVPPLSAPSGDPDGVGYGFVTIDVSASTVTYHIETVNISPDVPIALEIRGPATTGVGAVQIGGLDPTLDSNQVMSGTKEINVETIVTNIVESSFLYYVLLRTTGFPDGSIAARLGQNECRLTP